MIFSKVKLAIAVIFSLLLFNNVRLAKKVNDLDKQVGIAMNNAQVWENIANQNKNEARLLELTVNDFKNSNDSLIKVARDQQKKLKIKDNEIFFILIMNRDIMRTNMYRGLKIFL